MWASPSSYQDFASSKPDRFGSKEILQVRAFHCKVRKQNENVLVSRYFHGLVHYQDSNTRANIRAAYITTVLITSGS